MKLLTVLAALALVCALASAAHASPRHHAERYLQKVQTSPGCSDPVMRPCGLENYSQKYSRRPVLRALPTPSGLRRVMAEGAGRIVAHPAGCPRVAFCGCGAAVRLFGRPIRSLWLAANWFRFPRAAPAPGMAAVRRHHVFVLERHVGGSVWLVYDANSGRGLTRLHPRSIAGYVIVDPRGGA